MGLNLVTPLYGPRVDSIDVIRRGKVRRAKLYYLRGRTGKAARIFERTTGHGIGRKQKVVVPETGTAENPKDDLAAPIETPEEQSEE